MTEAAKFDALVARLEKKAARSPKAYAALALAVAAAEFAVLTFSIAFALLTSVGLIAVIALTIGTHAVAVVRVTSRR